MRLASSPGLLQTGDRLDAWDVPSVGFAPVQIARAVIKMPCGQSQSILARGSSMQCRHQALACLVIRGPTSRALNMAPLDAPKETLNSCMRRARPAC